MSQELREAAYHEAGHALLMRHFGSQVESVEVLWNESELRWDGNTKRSGGSTPLYGTDENGRQYVDLDGPLQESTIALAGCLSQTKFLARLEDAKAVFSKEQEWSALFEWMNDEQPEQLQPYPIRFQTQGAVLSIEAHPRSFGGQDRTVFLKQRNTIKGILIVPLGSFYDGLQEMLVDAMQFLDEPQTWSSISALSNALIDGCDKDGRGKISDGLDALLG